MLGGNKSQERTPPRLSKNNAGAKNTVTFFVFPPHRLSTFFVPIPTQIANIFAEIPLAVINDPSLIFMLFVLLRIVINNLLCCNMLHVLTDITINVYCYKLY